jgi:restriction system protein
MNPLMNALHELGGTGTISEINQKVIDNLKLPDNIVSILHGKSTTLSEVEYRLAWTRTYLKKYGLLQISERGVWAIKNEKRDIKEVNSQEVVNYVRSLDKTESKNKLETHLDNNDIDAPIEVKDWREKLIEILLSLKSDAFERLIKQLLRESGFSSVEVTGKTGDGGIDGNGIFRIAGLISFKVLFQCKKWQKTVSSSEIRDFRGAMQGRADKGLFVTTSNFTKDAIKEASRDGATPIDLIDGESLLDKLVTIQPKKANTSLLLNNETSASMTFKSCFRIVEIKPRIRLNASAASNERKPPLTFC